MEKLNSEKFKKFESKALLKPKDIVGGTTSKATAKTCDCCSPDIELDPDL